jgi:hypothetical protein
VHPSIDDSLSCCTGFDHLRELVMARLNQSIVRLLGAESLRLQRVPSPGAWRHPKVFHLSATAAELISRAQLGGNLRGCQGTSRIPTEDGSTTILRMRSARSALTPGTRSQSRNGPCRFCRPTASGSGGLGEVSRSIRRPPRTTRMRGVIMLIVTRGGPPRPPRNPGRTGRAGIRRPR